MALLALGIKGSDHNQPTGEQVLKVDFEAVKEASPAPSMSPFADSIYKNKYAHPGEEWPDTSRRVAVNVMAALGYTPESPEVLKLQQFITDRKFLPGGRYLYSAGRELHQCQNCLLMRAEDSREGWSELMSNAGMALMTGAGIGVDYSDIRPEGSIILKTGGVASGPISLMSILNEIGRRVMQGGSRRSAIWAGLNWQHPDIIKFIHAKDWSPADRERKAQDFNYPCELDMTNISVILDDEFFVAYENALHPAHSLARQVYRETVDQMVKKGEPGFSVDTGVNSGETLRNACTEVTSADDSDICNLGSMNLARIENIAELREVTKLATLFLLAGTVYSHLPYDKVAEVRRKNRRLGLGVMGVHEWLLQRGKKYGPDFELGLWMQEYARSGEYANEFADKHDLTPPVKTRAIAPTGTIGIIAETTTGIEPIYSVAFKRRYLVDGDKWKFQYVVDPTAHRLVEEHNLDPNNLEDAYTLSYDVERRVGFQVWMQQYVDHGISSTINLPYPIVDSLEAEAFGDMLMQYLPNLRGITAYPDGARGGQPLSVVPYEVAVQHRGVVFEESEERCVGGACGV